MVSSVLGDEALKAKDGFVADKFALEQLIFD